ncbi:MAG: PAS domain-containing protein [Planctomycetes bacterium]|nr:PAS domain-containing protein [Planctomycetota bacterium]
MSSLKNYLAGIIESSADGIIAIDLNRRVMAWNPAANVLQELAATVPDEPEGMVITDLLGGACREFALMLMRSIQEGRSFRGVEMRIADSGGRLRYFSASASPIMSESEEGKRKNVGAVLIFSELTEIRELEERANRHDRLAALGEMAAGVAHEIRNPLGGIELYASNLGRKFPADSPENNTCRKIIAAAASLNRIVTDMLTFTRSRPPQMRRAQLLSVVKGAVDMAAREIEQKSITVDLDIAADDAPRLVDPDQLVQAGLNVVLNAVQAMPVGGVLTVSVTPMARPDGSDGGVRLSFADTGPGIPDTAKDKVFNPFFTLRKDGTGLGLAIVHKIIQDYGGTIDVGDNQPTGAVVTFVLPGAVR